MTELRIYIVDMEKTFPNLIEPSQYSAVLTTNHIPSVGDSIEFDYRCRYQKFNILRRRYNFNAINSLYFIELYCQLINA